MKAYKIIKDTYDCRLVQNAQGHYQVEWTYKGKWTISSEFDYATALEWYQTAITPRNRKYRKSLESMAEVVS